ncbi:MAG: flagellar basal body-associated FliL family protein [Janthinobacterium lividum]
MADKKDEKTEAAASESGKKKPPMMIIMAVFAVVVLGGAFFMVQKASAKQKGGEVKKMEKGPVMSLDEFLVNLSDPGSDHFLKVTVGLELDKSKGKTAESLKEDIPAIRDAILTSLSSETRDQIAPEAGRDKLKLQIKKNVNEALGEEDVQKVYFTNFVTQ